MGRGNKRVKEWSLREKEKEKQKIVYCAGRDDFLFTRSSHCTGDFNSLYFYNNPMKHYHQIPEQKKKPL